jgi:hypothetical protein
VEDTRPGGHFSEDQLELYAFNRMPEPECARLEEHLLVCGRCQSRLSEMDGYIAVMKVAAVQPNKKPPERSRKLLLTSPLWVGGLALIVALCVYSPPRRSMQPSEVELQSLRGGASLMAHARAGAPLSLSIDTASLPKMPAYRLEIVDANGGPVWQASVSSEGERIRTRVPRNLTRGTYWVRLYGDSLLREYGLELN